MKGCKKLDVNLFYCIFFDQFNAHTVNDFYRTNFCLCSSGRAAGTSNLFRTSRAIRNPEGVSYKRQRFLASLLEVGIRLKDRQMATNAIEPARRN